MSEIHLSRRALMKLGVAAAWGLTSACDRSADVTSPQESVISGRIADIPATNSPATTTPTMQPTPTDVPVRAIPTNESSGRTPTPVPSPTSIPTPTTTLAPSPTAQPSPTLIPQSAYPPWDSSPRWSPDGNRILFVSYRNGIKHLYLINHEGTGLRRATDSVRREDHGWWIPDGSKMYVMTDIAIELGDPKYGPDDAVWVSKCSLVTRFDPVRLFWKWTATDPLG